MIHKLFSIHDAKANAYLPPFILPRVEMAERVFGDAINSEDHQFGKHPDDYTLFELGSFDDHTAMYIIHTAKISRGNGLEYVRTDSDQPMEGLSNAETSNGKTPTLSNEPSIQPSTIGKNSSE